VACFATILETLNVPPARSHSFFLAALICAALFPSSTFAAEAITEADLTKARAQSASTFKKQVSPFITTYCGRCHMGNSQKGGVTFESVLKKPDGPAFRLLLKRTATQIATQDMPPEKATKQPTDQERKVVLDWIAAQTRLMPKDPGPFVIRRLTKAEYGNTLHDLFGVDPAITRDLPDEITGAGYTNTLSPMLIEQYLSLANDVLDRAFAPPGAPPTPVQQRLLGPLPAPGEDAKAVARHFAKSLARLAYRRPPSDAEVDLLMRVFALATASGKPYAEAQRLVTKAILVSPQFLFITPDNADQTAANAPSGIVPLDDYQLASRLSYLLWSTMPDAELSALADTGKLHDPAVLAAQARRLLAGPRSRALFDSFGAQWLGLDKLAGKTFDPEKFPQMTPAMRRAMYDEGRLYFQSILQENQSLSNFIESDYTFLNSTLAPLYGLEGKVTGQELHKIKLTDPNRGGILTMPGILATSSFPNRTSAVNRGVWVLEQVLGEHVPPPPPNVPALDKQDPHKVADLTLRQRTEMHRANPVCANCHKILDPIGFGLENFDAIGRWRDKDDSGGKIDATGELPGGKSFTTPKELKKIIAARKEDFTRTLTGKLLAYALGHQLEGYDEIVVDQLTEALAKDDYHMQTRVVGLVTSYPFTHRRVQN
jgi:mono/diheme cytochrome c family protein